jgi:hypothetical protein
VDNNQLLRRGLLADSADQVMSQCRGRIRTIQYILLYMGLWEDVKEKYRIEEGHFHESSQDLRRQPRW